MNLADDVNEQACSSDSDEDVNKDNKTKMEGENVYDEIAMASLSMDNSISTARQDSAAMINHKNDEAPALPEDNEIVEATNEDEEE